MKKIILYILLLSAGWLHAQDNPRFTVEVSSDSVLLGNYIEVTFTLENAKGTNFEAPSFQDFRVLSGPHYASNFSMVNGEVSQSTSYSFQLEPKDVGNFYIEPAGIRVQGEVLETEPIEIMVAPNPDGIIDRPRNGLQFQFEWGRNRSLETPDTLLEKERRLKLKKKKKRKIYKI